MTTRDEIEAAPMFTVFPGARPVTRRLPMYGANPKFAIFDVGRHDGDVVDAATERGIPKSYGYEIQRDDEVAPEGYDDIDAAIDALAEGYSLVKLPDVFPLHKGEGWGMFVLDAKAIGEENRIPVPDPILRALVEMQSAAPARIARLRQLNAAASRYSGAWLPVDRELLDLGFVDVTALSHDERIVAINDDGESALKRGGS